MPARALFPIWTCTARRNSNGWWPWLAEGGETGSVEGGAWLAPQFLRDGDTWRGVVWNVCPDEVGRFEIRRPAGMPSVSEAWHLTPAGERLAVAVDGDTLLLDRPMHEWELVAMVCEK